MSEDYLAQQQPTLTWNTARGVWEKAGMANLLCEHWELFSETWQTSGWMRNGQVFELPMQAHRTTDSEFSSLPTPSTMEHLPAREGQARERQLRRGGQGSVRQSSGNLREDILQVLPTVRAQNGEDRNNKIYARDPKQPQNLENALAVTCLPTPTTRDYKDGSQPHERDGVVQTDTVARAVINGGEVKLMQTPQVDDGKNTGHNQNRRTTLASEVYDAEQKTDWGKFEPAIRRWEETLGRPAPAPTKPDGKDGAHRLSADFTEWMMGVPEGWITDCGLTRNESLKACGNGVVPQQAELALRVLLEGVTLPPGGGK
jgi:hypothetical protein